MTRLENWRTVLIGHGPYAAPELAHQRLHGQVFDHPTRPDGQDVLVSRVLGRDEADNVICHSRKYELGDPHPEYEAAHPKAKARLLHVLPLLYEEKAA